MTYETRLRLSKIIVSIATLLTAMPLISGIWYNRVEIFWFISLPIFFYLLWGKLHGTGRSVRIVGYLGLAYACSYFATSSREETSFIGLLTILFALGTIMSIKGKDVAIAESSQAS